MSTPTVNKPVKLLSKVVIYQKPFTREQPEGIAQIVSTREQFTEHDGRRFQFCCVDFPHDGSFWRWVELAPGQREIMR